MTVGEEYESWLADAAALHPGRASGAEDVVLQLYTSGTTGLPKGVMLTNDNCSAGLEVAKHWNVDETSVSLVAMPLFHIGGSGWANVALAHGGTNVLVPMIDPAGLLDTIEQSRITNAFLVPTVLQMMCAVPGPTAGTSRRCARSRTARRRSPRGTDPGAGGVQGAAVPGVRAHRDHRCGHRARLGRPRPGRAPRAPDAFRREALPMGGAQGRRPGDRR